MARLVSVPEKQRALLVLEFGGGRLHAADPVLRCGVQTGMSRPGDMEALHEAVRQDHSQGAHSLRRYR